MKALCKRTYRFAQAYWCLLKMQRIVDNGGFKSASVAVLKPWKPDSRNLSAGHLAVREIGWAVEMAGRWQIRKTECLHRALAAYSLLRNIGAQPRFVLATRSEPFASHAWTEIGETAIADEEMRAKRGGYTRLLSIPDCGGR